MLGFTRGFTVTAAGHLQLALFLQPTDVSLPQRQRVVNVYGAVIVFCWSLESSDAIRAQLVTQPQQSRKVSASSVGDIVAEML